MSEGQQIVQATRMRHLAVWDLYTHSLSLSMIVAFGPLPKARS